MNNFVVKLQKTPTLHKTIITMFHTDIFLNSYSYVRWTTGFKYNNELNKSGGLSATIGSYMFINSRPLFTANVKNKWTGMAGWRAGGSG